MKRTALTLTVVIIFSLCSAVALGQGKLTAQQVKTITFQACSAAGQAIPHAAQAGDGELYGDDYGGFNDGYYDDFFGDFFGGDDDYDWFGGESPEYDLPGAAHRSFEAGGPDELDVYAKELRLSGRALAGQSAYLIPLDELTAYFGYTLSGVYEPSTPGGVIPLNVMISHYGDISRAALIVGNLEEGMPTLCDMYRADGQVQTAEVMVLNGQLYVCAECAAFAMMIDCDVEVDLGTIRFWDSDTLPPPESGEETMMV